MSSGEDFYKVLGVSRDCSSDDIKRAYRKLAIKYHPDRNKNDSTATAKFKEVTEAYEVLSNPSKRSKYDRFGSSVFNGSGDSGFGGFSGFSSNVDDVFENFEDVMSSFFGGGYKSSRKSYNRPQRGSDIEVKLDISLNDCIYGRKAKVKLSKNIKCESCNGHGTGNAQPPGKCYHCQGTGSVTASRGLFSFSSTCTHCQGTGVVIASKCRLCSGKCTVKDSKVININIPAGIDTGVRIKVSGEGNPSISGGVAGDLYVICSYIQDSEFKRDGNDLYYNVKVNITKLILGDKISFLYPGGKNMTVVIPAGTEVGSKFCLRGKGVPSLSKSGAGDLYIVVSSNIPKNLTDRQLQLIKEFDELSN